MSVDRRGVCVAVPQWPPGWGSGQSGTGSAPLLGLSGSDHREYWCRRSPHDTGSPPGRPLPSSSPQTPMSETPYLESGRARPKEEERNRTELTCDEWD